jgi:hypothetical protein
MDVSPEMNKVVFDVIKARAKRKAQDYLNNVSAGSSRLKQCRTEDPQSSMHGAGPSNEAGDEHPFNPFLANFSWDDWDQCLNAAAL